MRSILVCCFMFSFTLFAGAQTILNADTIMRRVMQVERTDSSREARITLTTTARDGEESKLHGTLLLKKDHVIMTLFDSVTTGYPAQQIIKVSDTMWFYQSETNQVDISLGDRNADGLSQPGLFTTKGTAFKPAVLDKQEGDSIAWISLYPKNADANYNKVKLRVDLRTYRATGFWVYRKSGTVVGITLDYISINSILSDELFIFRKENYPPGLKVIDHRK